ncbi:MAG: hypothetical protein U0271_47950 [Polyangiaceae bacterium]
MPIRKVRIALVPTDIALQVAALTEAEEGWEWPAAWTTLQTAAHEAMEQTLEETTEIRALCELLAEADGIDVGFGLADGIDEDSFVGALLEADLRDLLAGDDPAEAATALVQLLEVIQESTSYYADVLVGGKRVELDEAVRALATEFQSQGIDVESEDVPGVFGVGPTVISNPPPLTPPPEKKSKKAKSNTNARGGFGGLDEDEAFRTEPRPGASLGRELSHEEHYFIHQTQIVWPIASERLEQLRKSVLKDNHPDRFASRSDEEKSHAHQRFVWLNTGADRLAERLKRGA